MRRRSAPRKPRARWRNARKRADKAEGALVREDRALDKLRASARVNLQLSGRYGAVCRNLTAALERVEALEALAAENQELRKQPAPD